MRFESKVKCVDGPRQQLTTGTEVREIPTESNPKSVKDQRQQLTTD